MTRPILWCLAAAALFGASTPVAKALLDAVPPLTLAGLLYLGAALAVAPFARRGGAPARRRDPANRRRLAGAVLFGGVLGPAALLYGLSQAPAASTALWLNLETVATALFAWLVFREQLGWNGLLANGLIVLAGVLLALPDGGASWAAAGWLALACACWGIDNNLTALIDGYTPAQSTLAKGLGAGLFNLGLGAAFEQVLPPASAVLGALGVGALAYGASLLLYVRGAQQLGAARSQMIFATGPFLGLAVAWLGFGEPVLGLQLAAAALMLGALWLLFAVDHAHPHAHPALHHTHRHRHDDGHHDHVHHPPVSGWHTHAHDHQAHTHTHAHVPDLHHRHPH